MDRGRDADDAGAMPASARTGLFLVTAVAVFAASAASAASGGDQEQVKLNAADQSAARATMIVRGDLRPAGSWVGQAITPDHTTPTCSNFHPKQSDLVVTGSAEFRWAGPGRIVVSGADVLKTRRMVQLDWQRSGTKAAIACSLAKAGASNIVVSKVSFPRLAPIAAAFRAFYDVRQGGQTLRLVTELAAVGHGRSELSIGEVAAASQSLAALHADAVRLIRIMLSRARA
jgi:hypothetical protein